MDEFHASKRWPEFYGIECIPENFRLPLLAVCSDKKTW